MKALVLRQIAAVKERISVEGGRVEAITALRGILNQINATTAGLIKQQQDARKQQQANLVASASADVDLAQITGNRQAEISARERVIAQLRKEQALTKKGTLEWKQLRNDIAAQNKAIADLNAEKKKQKDLFGQASFDFLQAQQGFASNLLGNLIPSGATGGLVGGAAGSPVQAGLTPQAGFAAASAQTGPTAGQAQTTNGLLGAVLQQLKILNGTQDAPEASRQNYKQRAIMDGVGGG